MPYRAPPRFVGGGAKETRVRTERIAKRCYNRVVCFRLSMRPSHRIISQNVA